MKTCKTCGSSDVHIMAWIHLNDGSWKGDIDVSNNLWCEKCKDHVEVEIKKTKK